MLRGLGIGIRLIIGLLIALSPVLAYAHPGKTDVRGGHKCWKGCRQWELYHGEYHLHDKDFRPIRLNQPPVEKTVKTPENLSWTTVEQEILPSQPPEPVVQPLPVPVNRPPAAVIPPPAEGASISLDPYTIALLTLLLMLMAVLLVVRKKRKG